MHPNQKNHKNKQINKKKPCQTNAGDTSTNNKKEISKSSRTGLSD